MPWVNKSLVLQYLPLTAGWDVPGTSGTNGEDGQVAIWRRPGSFSRNVGRAVVSMYLHLNGILDPKYV